MTIAILALLSGVLVAVVAIGLGLCHRELRAMRRGLAAIDEGEGRRAAAIIGSVQAMREPLDAIRAGVEELSPNRRATVEPSTPTSKPPTGAESSGLRLDLPRAVDDERDSEVETRLVRQPTAAELRAAGALPRGRAAADSASGSAPPVTLKPVCGMCKGSGAVRAFDGALEQCRACKGSGYVDPDEGLLDAEARAAQLPG